jgi:hypothetical protein
LGETLSETHKVEYLCNSAAAKRLSTAKVIILRDDTKMNNFVKAKNFLLLNDGQSDASRKCIWGISATKCLAQKKLKTVGNKKKVSCNDYNPAKDCIPNKEFRAFFPNSRKKWNKCRAAAHGVGATKTVPALIDEAGAAGFDLELYQLAKEHAHHEIVKSCTKSAGVVDAGDNAREEPTPKKKNAGWQFRCLGCQTED